MRSVGNDGCPEERMEERLNRRRHRHAEPGPAYQRTPAGMGATRRSGRTRGRSSGSPQAGDREESGVEVEVGRLVGVYSNLGRPEEGVPEQVVLAFSCEWVRGEPCAGDECTEAGWFTVEDALRLVEAPQQKAKLQDALADDRDVRYLAYGINPYEVLFARRS